MLQQVLDWTKLNKIFISLFLKPLPPLHLFFSRTLYSMNSVQILTSHWSQYILSNAIRMAVVTGPPWRHKEQRWQHESDSYPNLPDPAFSYKTPLYLEQVYSFEGIGLLQLPLLGKIIKLPFLFNPKLCFHVIIWLQSTEIGFWQQF